MIHIVCELKLKEGAQSNIQNIVFQITRDSVLGTFDELPQSLNSLLEKHNHYSDHDNVTHIAGSLYQFSLKINEDVFPIDEGGISHFISTIAGELLRSQTADQSVEYTKVKSIEWDALRSKLRDDNVPRIRNQFGLRKNEPLLGFSIKPRFGLDLDNLIEISTGVLNAGFHIVEPDTRRITLDSEKDRLIEFAISLPEVKKQSNRAFALNLSNRSSDLRGIVCRLINGCEGRPKVVKIDGGLNGFSLMEEAKLAASNLDSELIITSYPLIKKILANKVPSDFLNLAFSASGADIMYPSGRANILNADRHYEGDEQDLIEASRKKYISHLEETKFMPTVAGGVAPGQLHVFYELYGPDVSLFLGGAVALHADGPIAGAILCKKILDHAESFRNEHPEDKTEIISIDNGLINEIKEKYSGRDYVIPSVFFETNKRNVSKFSFEGR